MLLGPLTPDTNPTAHGTEKMENESPKGGVNLLGGKLVVTQNGVYVHVSRGGTWVTDRQHRTKETANFKQAMREAKYNEGLATATRGRYAVESKLTGIENRSGIPQVVSRVGFD